MTLLKYELKKLFGRRGLIVSVLLLLVLNAVIIGVSYKTTEFNIKNDELYEIYQLYLSDRETFDANYNKFLEDRANGAELTAEFGYYARVKNDVKNIIEHPNTLKKISISSERLMHESVKAGYNEGDYIYDFQNKTREMYANAAEKVRLPLTPISGWDKYFDYTIVNYILFAAVFLVICTVYVPERIGAIYPLIRTAKKGRVQLSLAKLGAVIISTALTVLLFFGTSFAVFALREGFSSALCPIQSIRAFSTCPYIITVGEYFMINTLVRLGGFILFGCICAFFASMLCDYVSSFAFTAIILAVNYILSTMDYNSLNAPPIHLNLFAMTAPDNFFTRYYAAEFGGKLVEFLPLYIIVVVGISLLSLIGAFCFIAYARRTSSSSALARLFSKLTASARSAFDSISLKINKKRRIRSGRGTLIGFELRKLLTSAFVKILILVLVVFRFAYAYSVYQMPSEAEEHVYREYMEYLDGEWTEEKSAYISSEIKRINDAIDRYEAMRESGDLGMDSEERLQIIEEADYAFLHEEPIKRVKDYENRMLELQRLGEETCLFAYDSGWKLINDRDADMITLFGILLVTCSVFGIEYNKASSSGNFADILRTARKGRAQTYFAKFGAILAVAMISMIFAELCDFIIISRNYGLPHGVLPMAQVLEKATFFTEEKEEMIRFAGADLIQITLSNIMIRVYSVIVFTLSVFVISCFIRKNIGVMIVSALVFLMPTVLVTYGELKTLSGIDFVNIASGSGLIYLSEERSASAPWLHVYIFVFVALVLMLLLLASAFIRWNGKINITKNKGV